MNRYALVLLFGAALLGGCRRPAEPESALKAKQKPQPAARLKGPAQATPGVPAETQALPEQAAQPSPATEKMVQQPPPALPAPKGPAGQVKPAMPETLVVPQPATPPKQRPGVRTQIVRALLDALDRIQGIEENQKEGVVNSLLAADEELGQILGGNSKRLILRANKKPPIPVVGLPSRAPVLIVPEKPAEGPAEKAPGEAAAAVPGPPSAAKSPAVQSLLKTLDDLQGEDAAVKEQLRKALLEADQKLSR